MGCVLSSSSGTCYCCVESPSEEPWTQYSSESNVDNNPNMAATSTCIPTNNIPACSTPRREQPKGWGLSFRNYTWFYRLNSNKKKSPSSSEQQFLDGVSVVPSGDPHPEGLSGRRSPLHPICGPPLPATPSGAYHFMDRTLGPANCAKFKRFGTFSGNKSGGGFRLQQENAGEEEEEEEEEIYRSHSETYEFFQPQMPMGMRSPLMEKFFRMQENQQQRPLPLRIGGPQCKHPHGNIKHGLGNGVNHCKGMAPLPPITTTRNEMKNRRSFRPGGESPLPSSSSPTETKPCRQESIESPKSETIIKVELIPRERIKREPSPQERITREPSPQERLKEGISQREDSKAETEDNRIQEVPGYARKTSESNVTTISTEGLGLLDGPLENGKLSPLLISFCQNNSLQRHVTFKPERCSSATPMSNEWRKSSDDDDDDPQNLYYNQLNFLSIPISGENDTPSKEKRWNAPSANSSSEPSENNAAVGVDSLRFLHNHPEKKQEQGKDQKNNIMQNLHEAANTGCVSCLRWMVEEEKVDPNCVDSEGATALHMAARKGHTEAVRWLLASGASLTLDGSGKSPINYAADNEHMECLSILIMYGTGSGTYGNGPFHIKEEFKASKCVCHLNGKNGLKVAKNGGSSLQPAGPLASSSPRAHQPFYLHPPRSSLRGCQHQEEVYVPSQSDPGTRASCWANSRAKSKQAAYKASTLNMRAKEANCDCSSPGRDGETGFFLHQPWREMTTLDERARDLFSENQSSKSPAGSDSGSESGYAEIGENYLNKDFSRSGSVEGSLDTPRNSGNSDESYSELSDPAAYNDYEDIYISSEDQQDTNGRAPTPPPFPMDEEQFRRAHMNKNDEDEPPEEGLYAPGSIPPPPEFDDLTLETENKVRKQHADTYSSTMQTENNCPPPPPPPPPEMESKKYVQNGHPTSQNGMAEEQGLKEETATVQKYKADTTNYGSTFALQSNESGAKGVSRRSRSSSMSAVEEAFCAALGAIGENDNANQKSEGHYDFVLLDNLDCRQRKEGGSPNNGQVSKQHLMRNNPLLSSFIPPKFPSPSDEDTLIKPSEYLKSISKSPASSPPQSRASSNGEEKETDEGKGAAFMTVLPAIPESEGTPPPPPPPVPSFSASAPSSPQLLSAISVRDLNSIQLRRTDNKLGKTLSAPAKTDSSVKEPNLVLQKDDLIAELKLSKDIIGIKKLKQEKMQIETKKGKMAEEEVFKQFTAENFVSKIPEIDSTGIPIPLWKRLMLARKAAEKARQEAEDQIEREKEERRVQAIPAWKRQLLQRKGEETRRSHPNLFTAFSQEEKPQVNQEEKESSNKENEENVQMNQDNMTKYPSDNEMDDQPIIPWRAQLRKTNSTLNLNE